MPVTATEARNPEMRPVALQMTELCPSCVLPCRPRCLPPTPVPKKTPLSGASRPDGPRGPGGSRFRWTRTPRTNPCRYVRARPSPGWRRPSPLRPRLTDAEIHRLTLSVRSAVGIESPVWLTDIAGLTRAEAAERMLWSARGLLQQALADADRTTSTSDRTDTQENNSTALGH